MSKENISDNVIVQSIDTYTCIYIICVLITYKYQQLYSFYIYICMIYIILFLYGINYTLYYIVLFIYLFYINI